MFLKLATVTAAAALISFSAYAQTQSGDTNNTQGGEADHSAVNQEAGDMHQVWSGASGDVFFSDTSTRKMRSEAEWPDRWSKLSDDQRAEIKRNCDAASQTNRDEAETGAICTFVGKN
ncbi:hypothetical protein JQ506_07405 [Shinella sp. PSBB067]|uniref:hypothetical protein n=1 Tax=Shinella sp. PSBB067 TaxID=2715959 RepID=UPI00193B5EF4|nr:hypothetical protein [Shinella sp. PSBB067]QRI64810.1 hypothetical protein JQ506_07405 [Shinella sp. PSBB067]